MANRTTRTAEKDATFFDALAAGGVIVEAADKAGYPRSSVYEWRKSDTGFSTAWDEAVEAAIQRLEKEADFRATVGDPDVVLHNGNIVMVEDPVTKEKTPLLRRKKSDVLLIFRLKALRPEMYRERVDMQGKVDVSFGLADRLEAARRRARGDKPKPK